MSVTLTMKPLTPNAGIMRWYEKELRRLVRIIRKATEKGIEDIYKKEKQEIEITVAEDAANPVTMISTFLENAQGVVDAYLNTESMTIAGRLLEKINLASEKQFAAMVTNLQTQHPESDIEEYGKILKLKRPYETAYMVEGELISDHLSEGVRLSIEASIAENVNLIKSISNTYFKDLTGQVMRFINAGMNFQELKEYINQLGTKTERRAELIAQDQTRKAFSTINAHRMADAGIRKFKWLHTGSGAHPREYHLRSYQNGGLNGGIFEFENPPVIDQKTGEVGFPAQLPYCKCVMIPVVDLTD